MVASKEANKSGTPFNNRGGKSNFRGGGRGPKNNNRGRGNPIQSSNPKPCCQICNRTGHTALDCYHRMDYSYQGRHPPSQLAAMAASFNQNNDQQWYDDSGATSHITHDLNNLSLQSGYQGKY